ncbi:pancreatic triacylglycerol lipase-like isoform X2 [Neocloeon triangulifer]|uniref:pancreatic triacylglycerol lipase-like isoform X2 n=1 Tax=Neocloeon triangulifer TaxID=2078957 RepID=UPI00286F5581|nr:pancreatic triacylglycerol lipase-like isoform X2 [Neocloeon triangulifer]
MASCARLTLAHWTAAATFLVAATYLAGFPLCSGQLDALRQLRQDVPGDMFLLDRDNKTGNSSKDCLQKSEKLQCPDPDIRFYLYVGTSGEADEINTTDPEWFAQSQFNPDAPTVMLVHGYRGGDSLMPTVVLKNAYIKLGTYNLITVDYGPLVRTPCYVQAVNNLKPVAKCISHMLSYFRLNNVYTEKFTCVGFSLGSHICGLIDNYVTEKLERIIALDPARPLLSNRRDNQKLDPKDAQQVLVFHTNAGFYGQTGWTGTIDFCVNNGAQPYCQKTRNEQLCSHAHAVCYMAQSLWKERAQMGEPCANRCPQNNFFDRRGIPVPMGEFTPSYATGTFCVKNEFPPYCLGADETDPTFGDERCCPVYPNKTRKRIGQMLSERRTQRRWKMWNRFEDDYL